MQSLTELRKTRATWAAGGRFLAVFAAQGPGPDVRVSGPLWCLAGPLCYSRAMASIEPSTAPHVGQCPFCHRETGNVTRHVPACERDRALIARAGAHAAEPESLHPYARLQRGVSDLDVARLLRGLETGVEVYPHHNTYRARGNLPLGALGRVVSECLRLGLVHGQTERTGPASWKAWLVPAPTHARHPEDGNRPACLADYSAGIKRWRLLNDLTLVDCQACVDALSEA